MFCQATEAIGSCLDPNEDEQDCPPIPPPGEISTGGLKFEADPTAKPARFIVRGAVDL